jgi:hypothetical protein
LCVQIRRDIAIKLITSSLMSKSDVKTLASHALEYLQGSNPSIELFELVIALFGLTMQLVVLEVLIVGIES